MRQRRAQARRQAAQDAVLAALAQLNRLRRLAHTLRRAEKGSLTRPRFSRASKRPLQPALSSVKVALMKRMAPLAASSRLDITPNWDDIQTWIITCSTALTRLLR